MTKRSHNPRLHDIACDDRNRIFSGIRGLLPQGLVWDAIQRPGSIMWSYFFAWAVSFELMEERICQLSQEIYCREAVETTDLWDLDYGIPDDCLALTACERKVWRGGADCAYFTTLLARHGWHVTDCESLSNDGFAFAGCAYAGCSTTGPSAEIFAPGSNLGQGLLAPNDRYRDGGFYRENTGPDAVLARWVGQAFHWKITIDLSLSPAWSGQMIDAEQSMAGCAEAGCATACSPDPSGAICLLELVKPAHTRVVVQFVNP